MRLRIRDLREDRDLTQKQIAEYLMCDQSLYSKYERGEREVPLNIIIKLADFYNVNIDYLVGRSNVSKRFNWNVRGDFMSEKLKIKKRSALKGEDGYKTFSIRIKDETVERLDEIARQTNRYRNDIINMMLEFAINNCEITEDTDK